MDIDDKFGGLLSVALRKESVDRNYIIKITEIWGAVALRKESVDRNSIALAILTVSTTIIVALRKESVDRNLHSGNRHNVNREVALRKESVDRNLGAMQIVIIVVGRSPQGERG